MSGWPASGRRPARRRRGRRRRPTDADRRTPLYRGPACLGGGGTLALPPAIASVVGEALAGAPFDANNTHRGGAGHLPLRPWYLVAVAGVLVVMIAAILSPSLWLSQFSPRHDRRAVDRHRPVHGLRDGPVLRRVSFDTRRSHDRRHHPAHAHPDADAVDHHLHRRLVFGRAARLSQSRISGLLRVLAAARHRHRAHRAGAGVLLPMNLKLYFEIQKPTPDHDKLQALDAYLCARGRRAGHHAGCWIILVMARFATGVLSGHRWPANTRRHPKTL